MIKVNIKKSIEDDVKRNTITWHQLSFMLTSNEEYIEDYIANTRHELYLLYDKPIEVTSKKCQGEQLSVDMVKHTVSHLDCILMLTDFILVFVESN